MLLLFTCRAANIKYVNGKEREISPQSLSDVWTEAYKEVFCCANWEDLSWLQSETKLPIILKGVLSGEFHFKNSFSLVCLLKTKHLVLSGCENVYGSLL